MKNWTCKIIVFLATASMLVACGPNGDSRQRIDINRGKGTFKDPKNKPSGSEQAAPLKAGEKNLFSDEYKGTPADNVLSLYTQAPGNYALSKVSSLIENGEDAAGGVKIELKNIGQFDNENDVKASDIRENFTGDNLTSSIFIPRRLIIDQSITLSSGSVLELEVSSSEAKLNVRNATDEDELNSDSIFNAKEAIMLAGEHPQQAKQGIGVPGSDEWFFTVETLREPVKFIITFAKQGEKIRKQVILEYKKIAAETE